MPIHADKPAIVTTDPQAQATQAAALVRTLQQRWGARLIETHISWVLLDGVHAWKFKKPVRLSFLDFSELATRRRLCEAELQLNRRLAPTLYLDVLPIGGTPTSPEVGGTGPAIEYVLRMKQFAAGALMSERLAAGTLRPHHIDQLAQCLALFHAQAGKASADSPHGTPQRIVQSAMDVLTGLTQQGHGQACATLQAWLAPQAMALHAIWINRHASGCIVEGHGDLHLANVVILDDEVTAFDCIEFDASLRWIDPFNDIAFLIMDLMAHGRSDLAYRFLSAYLDASGDHEGLPTLHYYLVCRALVRAMVAGLPGAQVDAAEQTGTAEQARAPGHKPDYMDLALRLTQPMRPRLLITHGVSGSGKSYQTQGLLEAAGAIRLRSDVERRRLPVCSDVGVDADTDTAQRYSAAATQVVYGRLHALAEVALSAGYPVIVDATFLRQAERARFQQLAQTMSVPFHILHCDAPVGTLRQRIHTRLARGDDPSQADEAVLTKQLQTQDPLTPDELRSTIRLQADDDSLLSSEALLARWMGSSTSI